MKLCWIWYSYRKRQLFHHFYRKRLMEAKVKGRIKMAGNIFGEIWIKGNTTFDKIIHDLEMIITKNRTTGRVLVCNNNLYVSFFSNITLGALIRINKGVIKCVVITINCFYFCLFYTTNSIGNSKHNNFRRKNFIRY